MLPGYASNKSDNQLRTTVASTSEQLAFAYCIRSICFVEERGFPLSQEIDANDLHASHFLMYSGDEPIATSRIRWFADFAKIEKTSFRKEYRDMRILRRYVADIFDYIRLKGYKKVVTVADPQYGSLWIRLFKFKKGREIRKAGREDVPYFELTRDLDPSPDAVTADSDPSIMFRMEGAWDVPSTFG